MKIVVKSSCTQAETGWGNIAVIELYDNFIPEMVERKALIEELREKGVVGLTYWASNCWWYDDVETEDGDQMEDLGFTEEQVGHLNEHGYVLMPDAFSFDGDDDEPEETSAKADVCRTGADKLIVEVEGFFFRAYVKHADNADVETWNIPWEAIICPIHGIDPAAERLCLRCMAHE